MSSALVSGSGAVWQSDKDAPTCTKCRKSFTVQRRRHHCRECGRIFCDKCSSFRSMINNQLKRSCFDCYQQLLNRQNSQEPFPTAESAGSRSSSISQTINPTGIKWYEGIVLIRQYQDGITTSCDYPQETFSKQFLLDLQATMTSLMTSLDKGKVLYRLRDQSLPGFPFKDESDETIGTAITNATIFYNCFISVSSFTDEQTFDVNLSYKECVCLVSKWPFRQLSHKVLESIHEALELQTKPLRNNRRLSSVADRSSIFSSPPQRSISSPSSAPSSLLGRMSSNDYVGNESFGDEDEDDGDPFESIIKSVLEVAFNQIRSWPSIVPGSNIYLTFFGHVLNTMIPLDLDLVELNPRLSHMTLPINLLEVLGTLGLIQHLWTLWELIVTGQDIVVVATNPVHCCELVLALSSLLEPISSVGDVRPFMPAGDKDLLVLAATSQLKVVMRQEMDLAQEPVEITTAFKKLLARNRSIIVGVTEKEALSILEDFSAAIFVDSGDFLLNLEKEQKFLSLTERASSLSPEEENVQLQLYGNYRQEMSDTVFKGLRTRNAATEKYIAIQYTNDGSGGSGGGSGSSGESSVVYKSYYKKKRGFAKFLNFKEATSTLKEPLSYGAQWEAWQHQAEEAPGKKCHTWFLFRTAPTTIPLTRIVKRILRLHPDDRLALGDQLLRDNLQDISKAFLSSGKDGTGGSEGGAGANVTPMRTTSSLDGGKVDQEVIDELISQRRSLEMAREAEAKGMWRQGADDILDWVKTIPLWIVHNLATVFLWAFYLCLFGVLAWIGVPSVVIVIAAYMINIPETAPEAMVHIVDTIFPVKWIATRLTTSSASAASAAVGASGSSIESTGDATAAASATAIDGGGIPLPDLTGVWRRVRVENYEAFLAAQGVNYLQRKVAASIAMQHTLVVDHIQQRLHLEEKGGPVEVETDYFIDPTKFKDTQFLKATFEDTVVWDTSYRSVEEQQQQQSAASSPPSAKLLIIKKRLPDCSYELRIWRWLVAGANGLPSLRLRALYRPLAAAVHHKNLSTTEVESFCTFEFVGPPSYYFSSSSHLSPSPRDKTSLNPAEEDDGDLVNGDDRDGADDDVDDDGNVNDSGTGHSRKNSNGGDGGSGGSGGSNGRAPALQSTTSHRVEEEILAATSTDGGDIIYETPLSSGKSPKGWLTRRFSSRKLLSVGNNHSSGKEEHSHSETAAAAETVHTPRSTGSGKAYGRHNHNQHNSQHEASPMDTSPIVTLATTTTPRVVTPIVTKPAAPQYVDFSGVWIRTRTDNFEAFAEASGIPPLQRKVAAQMSLTHIITMNPPELSAIRLQERGGPLNTDFTMTINSEHDVAVMLYGKRMLHRAWYLDPETIIMFRRAEDASFEHVLIRTLDAESSASRPRLILRSLHRDLRTGKEVQAISFFSKVSASANPPPLPEYALLSAAGAARSPGRRKSFLSSASSSSASASASTSTAAAAIRTPTAAASTSLPAAVSAAFATTVPAEGKTVENDVDLDCNDDDDDEALQKMRTMSFAKRERQVKAIRRHEA